MHNSPPKAHQSRQINGYFQNDSADNFANKYLSELHEEGPPELMREHLDSEANSINAALASLFPDRPRLGLLFSSDPYEQEKTLALIKMLLSQRQKDLEGKNEIYSNLRRAEAERAQLNTQLQKVQRELKRVEVDRENLAAKVKGLEKTHRETVEICRQKLTGEREEWARKYRGIQTRENQYLNASRKQEQTIKSLQDKVGRGQDKGGVRNSFEVMQQLQTYGPTFVMVNAEHEYNQIVAKTMEDNYAQIVAENQFYKDTLQNIQKELQTVLDLKCEVQRRRRGYDSEFDSTFELAPLRPQLLNLPQAFNRQPVAVLHENVSRFKDAMRAGQAVDEREADQKLACVSNVKSLIRNYKNVVESQEQLLSRVILKAKEFKSGEMQAIESRNSKAMDEDELERARRFIEEQNSYLGGKNRELELTRKAMHTTMRKVEQEREEFSRRSGQAAQELQRVQRQIEQLPAMVEKELNSH